MKKHLKGSAVLVCCLILTMIFVLPTGAASYSGNVSDIRGHSPEELISLYHDPVAAIESTKSTGEGRGDNEYYTDTENYLVVLNMTADKLKSLLSESNELSRLPTESASIHIPVCRDAEGKKLQEGACHIYYDAAEGAFKEYRVGFYTPNEKFISDVVAEKLSEGTIEEGRYVIIELEAPSGGFPYSILNQVIILAETNDGLIIIDCFGDALSLYDEIKETGIYGWEDFLNKRIESDNETHVSLGDIWDAIINEPVFMAAFIFTILLVVAAVSVVAIMLVKSRKKKKAE